MSKRQPTIKDDASQEEATLALQTRYAAILDNKCLTNIEIAAIHCILAVLDYKIMPSNEAEEKIKTQYAILGIELEKLNHANSSIFTTAKKSINNLNQMTGCTPAHLIFLAIAYDNSEADPRAMLLALDKCRPNLNLKTNQGDSCLHILLKEGSLQSTLIILKWLLARKVDIAATDKAGNTALHLITKKYDIDSIETFLRYDLEKAYSLINQENQSGETPQSILSAKQGLDIIDLFFKTPEEEFFHSKNYLHNEQHLFSINI